MMQTITSVPQPVEGEAQAPTEEIVMSQAATTGDEGPPGAQLEEAVETPTRAAAQHGEARAGHPSSTEEPDVPDDWRALAEQNAQQRQKTAAWLESNPFPRLMVMRAANAAAVSIARRTPLQGL